MTETRRTRGIDCNGVFLFRLQLRRVATLHTRDRGGQSYEHSALAYARLECGEETEPITSAFTSSNNQSPVRRRGCERGFRSCLFSESNPQLHYSRLKRTGRRAWAIT